MNPKKIIIEIIPHQEHRYETVGDYWIDSNGNWQVRVSEFGTFDHQFLVAMHELTEFWLTQKRGVTEESISEFDILFESERQEGKHGDMGEPGNDIRAPYRKEHRFSENIERQLALEGNIDWHEYDKLVMSL